MKINLLATLMFALLAGVTANAGSRSSANYTIAPDTTDLGGLRAMSVSYTNNGSAEGIVGTSSVASPSETVKDGYVGQLNNIADLVSITSTKTHGSAGTFAINLPTSGNLGIECRSGGANGDHTLVFTFLNTLTSVSGASVTTGTGSIASKGIGADPHQYLVNLTGVANAQLIRLSLANVTDSAGGTSSTVDAWMGVLLGDSTGNATLTPRDLLETKIIKRTGALM